MPWRSASLCAPTECRVSTAAEEGALLRRAETLAGGVRRERPLGVHLHAVQQHALNAARQTVGHLSEERRPDKRVTSLPRVHADLWHDL